MPELVALALPGGPAFVAALQRVWDDGDAVFPLDLRLPPAAVERVLDAVRPSRIVDGSGSTRRDGGRVVEPGDALVVATSGTTGDPKGVVLTHDAVAASARATSDRLGVGPGDAWLCCLPLAHVGGLSVVTRAMVTAVPLTVLPGFDATSVEAAARAGCTLTSLVPTALARIDPALFRTVLVGGSSMPDHLPLNAVTTYGMTETGSGLVYDGRPLDGVDVTVTADGEIRVRGPMLLRSYRDGTDPKDAHGWLSTGDAGRWGEDGRLQVFGRRGDVIVTGGEKVWPEAVERVLAGLPGVADVAVAGRPDAEWGHRVVACVVPGPDGPPALGLLRDAAKAQLPPYCAPREVVVVDAVPRTALGKVARSALRVLLDAQR